MHGQATRQQSVSAFVQSIEPVAHNSESFLERPMMSSIAAAGEAWKTWPTFPLTRAQNGIDSIDGGIKNSRKGIGRGSAERDGDGKAAEVHGSIRLPLEGEK